MVITFCLCMYVYIYGKKIAGPTPMQPIIWWLTKRSFTTPSKSGTEHACNININIYICVYIYKFRKYVHTFIFGCPVKSQIIISKLFTPTLTWTSHFHLCRWRAETLGSMLEGFLWDSWHMPSIAIMLFSSKIRNFKSLNYQLENIASWKRGGSFNLRKDPVTKRFFQYGWAIPKRCAPGAHVFDFVYRRCWCLCPGPSFEARKRRWMFPK